MIRLASVHDYQSIKTFDPFSGSRKEDVKDQRVFVCLQDGQVSGYISMARAELLGRPYVQYLAVAQAFQRRGIALRLISHIESRYTNKRLFISTESSNNIMQELLLKLAYVPAGEISGANLNGTKELFYYKDENA
ncbi:MAG: GNAT family N-acetyltransferase [Pseudomonadales bacterium]|nr:GNAT family N-acetyltransferase [Pseudomonadales bacterium]